ncbi:MAG: HEAT repeat domain-containing protein [Deltaproteobacteria bacterium]|nr:HEAT repeat domain-containing protein [Deltaproteobacteria bacterium]
MLHLDLKPSNVMLDASGEPRILDVGLTRAVHTPEEHGYQSPTDEVGGRTLYRAPEQIRDDAGAVDARADVWSLGALLYELLTGVPAFTGGTRRDTVREVLDEEPKAPSAIDADLAPALDVIVAKALEKRAADRYGSAAALADDLERFLAGKPIEARPPSGVRRLTRALRRHRHRIFAGLAAALAVAALAGGAWWWLRDPLVSVREDLASPRADTRAAALERGLGLMELGRLDAGQRVAMIDLTTAALGDRSDAVRRVALERLTRQPGAIPDDGSPRREQLERGIAACLARPRSAELREAAFRATEVFQARGVTPALIELARDPETPEAIAGHAIRVLGAVAHDDVIVDLMHLVGRGGAFRTRAMQAISRIVERSAAGQSGAPAAAPTSSPGTGSSGIDRNRTTRHAGPDRVVANVLATVKAPAGEDPILYALRAGNTDTKLRVIWVLHRSRDARTTTLLPTLFADDDPVVARAAAAILVEFGGPVVERKLQEAMASDSSRVRGNAAFALGELNHPDALDTLVKALFREPDPGARADIARALGRLGQKSAMPHLIRALDDIDPRVHQAAHAALATLATEDAGETSTAWQEWWDTH